MTSISYENSSSPCPSKHSVTPYVGQRTPCISIAHKVYSSSGEERSLFSGQFKGGNVEKKDREIFFYIQTGKHFLSPFGSTQSSEQPDKNGSISWR